MSYQDKFALLLQICLFLFLEAPLLKENPPQQRYSLVIKS